MTERRKICNFQRLQNNRRRPQNFTTLSENKFNLMKNVWHNRWVTCWFTSGDFAFKSRRQVTLPMVAAILRLVSARWTETRRNFWSNFVFTSVWGFHKCDRWKEGRHFLFDIPEDLWRVSMIVLALSVWGERGELCDVSYSPFSCCFQAKKIVDIWLWAIIEISLLCILSGPCQAMSCRLETVRRNSAQMSCFGFV